MDNLEPKTVVYQEASMVKDSEKLTFWQKLGYGLGDFYGGGAGTLISFFLPRLPDRCDPHRPWAGRHRHPGQQDL